MKSPRGASFSFALLLFLVCVVVSSVVLAASSASIGRLATQGKADQRYYSVTSAAQLFQNALDGATPDGVDQGDPGTLTYTLVEQRQGTRTITRSQSGSSTETFAEDKSAANAQFNAPTVQGYDFLSNATAYALFGVAYDQVKQPSDYATNELKELDWGTWLLSGSGSDSATSLPSAKASTATFEIVPSIPGLDTSKGDYKVSVDAQLNADWTCDLYFHNNAENDADKFYLYMKLAAAVSEDVSTDENLQGSTTAADSNSTVNTETVKQTKTTTVTWAIERIVPGRGPVSGS